MSQRILVVDDSPTIRKVVSSILEANAYGSVQAKDGLDALEKLRDESVDLVLLDFVMPRMNGYQFCRELRANGERNTLPVVLMSAKGDKIRGQFVRQTGAVDAITKPFDARALIAVVESAMKKAVEGRMRPVPEASEMPEEEETIHDSLKPAALELSDDPGLRRVQAAHAFATAIAKVVVPELCNVPDVPHNAHGAFTEAIQRAVAPDDMMSLWALMKTLDYGEGTRDVLAGDISVVAVAEVLQLLQLQRQTGALVINTSGAAEVTLYVKEGNLSLARATGLHEEFRLGRYLVANGALTRGELEHFLNHRAGSKRLIGEALVKLSLATQQQVDNALQRQTQELVYEVVRWRSGRFTFSVRATSPEAEKAALDLSIGAIVMEGFRRVDEWRLIEGSFDFEEVLFPDQIAISRIGDATTLTEKERSVLDLIDGERTVREIVDAMEGSSFDVSKIIYQFLNSRLVRRSAA